MVTPFTLMTFKILLFTGRNQTFFEDYYNYKNYLQNQTLKSYLRIFENFKRSTVGEKHVSTHIRLLPPENTIKPLFFWGDIKWGHWPEIGQP